MDSKRTKMTVNPFHKKKENHCNAVAFSQNETQHLQHHEVISGYQSDEMPNPEFLEGEESESETERNFELQRVEIETNEFKTAAQKQAFIDQHVSNLCEFRMKSGNAMHIMKLRLPFLRYVITKKGHFCYEYMSCRKDLQILLELSQTADEQLVSLREEVKYRPSFEQIQRDAHDMKTWEKLTKRAFLRYN
jgi:hypothetical protein